MTWQRVHAITTTHLDETYLEPMMQQKHSIIILLAPRENMPHFTDIIPKYILGKDLYRRMFKVQQLGRGILQWALIMAHGAYDHKCFISN